MIARTRFHVVLAAMAFALCYTGVIITLVTIWANSYLYSYGFAVAFISGYMLWITSGKLSTLDLVPDYLFGVPVTLAGIAMLAAGHLGALVSLQQVSLLVTLAGFILMLFGRRVFHLTWVPLLYLLLAMPIWDSILARLGPPSQVLSGAIAVSLLHSIGVPAVQEGTLIVLPNLILDVLPQCSGVNQLMAIVAMTLPAAYLWLQGYARRVTLVGIAVAVAYLSNGVRIAIVGLLAHRGLGDGDMRTSMHLFEGLAVSILGYLLLFGCLYRLTSARQTGTIEINQVVPEARVQRGLIFWYDLNGRIVADMYLAKAYTVWDALTRRRTNGAVIMVAWEYPAGVELDASRLKAIGFVRELVPLLRRHMPS